MEGKIIQEDLQGIWETMKKKAPALVHLKVVEPLKTENRFEAFSPIPSSESEMSDEIP